MNAISAQCFIQPSEVDQSKQSTMARSQPNGDAVRNFQSSTEYRVSPGLTLTELTAIKGNYRIYLVLFSKNNGTIAWFVARLLVFVGWLSHGAINDIETRIYYLVVFSFCFHLFLEMALFQINIDDEFANKTRLEYYRGEIALNEWINCEVIFDETKIRQPRSEDNPKGIYNFEADIVYSGTIGGIDIDANITFTVEIYSAL
jgi:hypothetical protein